MAFARPTAIALLRKVRVMTRLRITLATVLMLGLNISVLRAQTVEELNYDALTPGRAVSQGEPNLERAEQLILNATNEFRKAHGLQPVRLNPALVGTAQYFAHYMGRAGKYGHEADGQRPSERAVEHGYYYCILLENIAFQFSSKGFTTEQLAQGFIAGWEKSPEHRRNMLNPYVSDIGIAVAAGEKDGKYYAVQDFGRPRSARILFKISNHSENEVRYKLSQDLSNDSPQTAFTLPPRYTRTHQRCRPTKLTFLNEGLQKQFTPPSGAQYIITGTPQGLQIEVGKLKIPD
jgi:uncharacterized protein YkwD